MTSKIKGNLIVQNDLILEDAPANGVIVIDSNKKVKVSQISSQTVDVAWRRTTGSATFSCGNRQLVLLRVT